MVPLYNNLATETVLKPLPTIERLREVLVLDTATGELRWRVSRPGVRAGSRAGCMAHDGYRVVVIDRRQVREHVAVWALHHGDWPAHEIDHRDRDRTNNRPGNLRPATRQQQKANSGLGRNNTSGVKGVSLVKATGRWYAAIQVNGRSIGLGYYEAKADAAKAYAEAARRYFGDYSHHQ